MGFLKILILLNLIGSIPGLIWVVVKIMVPFGYPKY